jgi:2-oxoglutarate dehydrogenase E1 component
MMPVDAGRPMTPGAASHDADREASDATMPMGGDSAFFLDLYARYRRDPQSVPADWRLHFETMDGAPENAGSPDALAREMTAAFRAHGHLEATLDPLDLAPRPSVPMLDRLRRAANHAGLQDHLAVLERAYCGTAALEAAHLHDETARDWIFAAHESAIAVPFDASRFESACEAIALADEFDAFVKLKMPTKKRFGSEGSEGSVVLLKELLRAAATTGHSEIVIGGIHRGRLATLATLLGKPAATLFAEIKGRDLTDGGPDFTSDIPYHLGHAADLEFDGVPMRVAIAPHPSHLMVVAPVAMGLARARRSDVGQSAMCILMHTDASISGQGLAAELMQLSGLAGYTVGGTVHIVVNNQIGFTTLPSEGRTARYCTDVAKMIGAPVFHVNGDDPEALVRVAGVSHAWRQRFGSDVVIDMVCTRTNGHNELDEPRFTQPAQYAAIDARTSLRKRLTERLRARAPEAALRIDGATAALRQELETGYALADTLQPNARPAFQAGWERTPMADETALLAPVATGLDPDVLPALADAITSIPADIDANPKVRRFYEERSASLTYGSTINFATAEALALGSMLREGTSVRMSGQDLVRGTFTQRHMRVHDRGGTKSAIPLTNAEADGARFEAINSPLSEYGVLGFEYGHSLASPKALTIWEAQFGDFLNGAQIVLDQYISSAEAKWLLRSGLVMLLPHGLEGQGPDHSSARIERILQLCANGNMVVANPTTPANHFHLLRRQVHAAWRKPLAVIAPKSLLRLKAASSPVEDVLGDTRFLPVIVDQRPDPAKVERVVLCSGKVYYDLLQAAETAGIADSIALVRIEQLYPLEIDAISAAINGFPRASHIVWCQEEPENQGAWLYMRDRLLDHDRALGAALVYAGRRALPVAAGGSIGRHEAEQRALVAAALGLE